VKGQGALVDPVKLGQWYAAHHHLVSVREKPARERLDALAEILWDALKRDSSGLGMPIHELLSIPVDKAAGFLVLLHRYVYLRHFDREPQEAELPEPILRLFAIARTHAHGGRVSQP
jgi:hypothetical protein